MRGHLSGLLDKDNAARADTNPTLAGAVGPALLALYRHWHILHRITLPLVAVATAVALAILRLQGFLCVDSLAMAGRRQRLGPFDVHLDLALHIHALSRRPSSSHFGRQRRPC